MARQTMAGQIDALKRELRGVSYAGQIDEVALAKGKTEAFVPLIGHSLFCYSRYLAKHLLDKGFNSAAKNDVRMVEGVFKMLRAEFQYQPKLRVSQFFGAGFAEQKVLFLCDIVRIAKAKHLELWKKHKDAQMKVAMKGYKPNARLLPRAKERPKSPPRGMRRTKAQRDKQAAAAAALAAGGPASAAHETHASVPPPEPPAQQQQQQQQQQAWTSRPATAPTASISNNPWGADSVSIAHPQLVDHSRSHPLDAGLGLRSRYSSSGGDAIAEAEAAGGAEFEGLRALGGGGGGGGNGGGDDGAGGGGSMAAVEAAMAAERSQHHVGLGAMQQPLHDEEPAAPYGVDAEHFKDVYDAAMSGTLQREPAPRPGPFAHLGIQDGSLPPSYPYNAEDAPPPAREAAENEEKEKGDEWTTAEGAKMSVYEHYISGSSAISGTNAGAVQEDASYLQEPQQAERKRDEEGDEEWTPENDALMQGGGALQPQPQLFSPGEVRGSPKGELPPGFGGLLEAVTAQIKQSFTTIEERLSTFERKMDGSVQELSAKVTIMEGRIKFVEERTQGALSSSSSSAAGPLAAITNINANATGGDGGGASISTGRGGGSTTTAKVISTTASASSRMAAAFSKTAAGAQGGADGHAAAKDTREYVEAVAARFSDARQFIMAPSRQVQMQQEQMERMRATPTANIADASVTSLATATTAAATAATTAEWRSVM